MKNKICCFSGHRKMSEEKSKVYEKLNKQINILINEGYDTFICGGALGFDTLCALAVLKAKDNNECIKLVLALPCENQTKNWRQNDIDIYNSIIEKSDKVIYTSSQYYNGCMHRRNRFMVDNSSCCICYLNNSYGGTAYTVKYADCQGLRIINLAEHYGTDASEEEGIKCVPRKRKILRGSIKH